MYRLIVVDDDVDAVNNLSKNYPWEASGFTLVETFQDGKSALEWLRSHTVELILCDIKMPCMNGIELARQMQLIHRPEKIIFVSGFKDFDYAQKALEYGVFRYCIKPVTYREMQTIISAVCKEITKERNSLTEKRSEPEEQKNGVSHNISDVKIDLIKSYVCKHYTTVTLQQLADHMQMNTSYLSSFFRNKTGKKLFDYITEVRLNAAFEILKTDSFLNVAEIAERVGYTNAISFSRSFKKQFGVPPSEVRRDFDATEMKK